MSNMESVLRIAVLALVGGAVLASTAWAAPAKSSGNSEPAGSAGSGAVTATQITKDLQFLLTEREGIVVNFVLPRGWELVEESTDPKRNIYALISRAPVTKKGDPTDLLFELDIYKHGLLEDLPADTPQDQRDSGVQLWNFLNAQITMNLKAGAKCTTKPQNIEAKPYGPPSRDPTMFVPIFYDIPAPPKTKGKGSTLFTFTSMVGDKVWMVKFLVAKDQVDNYGALIALVLNNSFGMTKEKYDELVKQSKQAPPAKPGAGQGNAKVNK
jgi:hypothetical protein